MYKLISRAEGTGKGTAEPTSEEVDIIREAFTEDEFEEGLDFWTQVRRTGRNLRKRKGKFAPS